MLYTVMTVGGSCYMEVKGGTSIACIWMGSEGVVFLRWISFMKAHRMELTPVIRQPL